MTKIQCAWNPEDHLVIDRSELHHKDAVLFVAAEAESADIALTIEGVIELRDALDKIIKSKDLLFKC
jgi:hypothetical protein